MNTLDLLNYYPNLLINQYVGLPKAYATIFATVKPIIMPQQSEQQITFTPAPTTGTFVLSYNLVSSTMINWNDSTSTVQTALRTISALSTVTVSGSIAAGLTVNFVGVTGVAELLVVANNSLLASSALVQIVITETDQTLPLAVQDAFNPFTAVGVQLDVVGKYAGVTRNVNTSTGSFVLGDADFLTLIKFAILQNSSGSSLSQIESNFNTFFPGQFIITDFKNMYMSYVLSSSLGSSNLFRALVAEGLIPRPMGVGISLFIPPVITNFFGFSSYAGLNPLVQPFNTYTNFNTTWRWLSYANATIV